MGRRTSIVLVTPDPVPDTRNHASKDEDDGGVVDGFGGNGDGGGHAEEGHSQQRPGESDPVGDSTKLSEVELASLDLLATSSKTDSNRSGVRSSQANDTDTGESVESGGGSEVDNTEDDLNNHAKHHSIQGNIERGVDLGPHPGTGNGTITSESPSASRTGSCAANTANNGENDERNEKTEGTAGAANSALDDERHGLGGDDDVLDLGHDEHERDEEEKTGEGVDEDGSDHGLGDLDLRVLNLLAHGDNHSSRRSSISSVEETDAERPSLGPAGVVLEVCEDPVGITTSVLSNSKDSGDDSDETSEGPEDSGGINPGKPLVTERRDSIAQESQAKEDKEDLVRLSRHDTNARALLEDIDTADDEEGGTEVHGESDGDVSNDIEPATNPASNATPSRRRKHKGLVVNTSSGRIDTGDFTERASNTDNDEGDGEPAPDDVDGTASNQRVNQGGSETVGDGSEDEGHEGDLEGRAVTRQLSLVAEVLEELISTLSVSERGL